MRFSVNIWDALFGEKTTLEWPDQDGNIGKRQVTRRWLEKLKEEGTAKHISTEVRVHMLHLDREEELLWVIGQDVDQETVDRFWDPETCALYAMTHFEAGEPQTSVMQKHLWDAWKEKETSSGLGMQGAATCWAQEPDLPPENESARMSVDCPKCGLINPSDAQRCDCGYEFETSEHSTSSEMARNVAITCIRIMLSDEPWQGFGFPRRPRVGLVFRRFRSGWKNDLENRLMQEMFATIVAAHRLADRIGSEDFPIVIGTLIDQPGIVEALGHSSREEASERVTEAITQYVETPVAEWHEQILKRIEATALPDKKLSGRLLVGSISFTQTVGDMIPTLRQQSNR